MFNSKASKQVSKLTKKEETIRCLTMRIGYINDATDTLPGTLCNHYKSFCSRILIVWAHGCDILLRKTQLKKVV